MRHGQLAEQFYHFIQTPLARRGMASLQSNSTFSFKHHLTGEAWPACSNSTFSFKHHSTGEACRAILPLHSTPLATGMACFGIVSVYCTYVHYSEEPAPKHIFASGTVSKNRHLRSAEKHPGGRLCMRPARLCPGDRCARRR